MNKLLTIAGNIIFSFIMLIVVFFYCVGILIGAIDDEVEIEIKRRGEAKK